MRVGLQTRADRTLFFESYRQPGTVFPQSHRQTVALSSLCPTGNQLLCLPLSHRQPGAVFPLSHRQPGAVFPFSHRQPGSLSSLCPTGNQASFNTGKTKSTGSVPQSFLCPRGNQVLCLPSVPGATRRSVFPQSQEQPGALSSLSLRGNQELYLGVSF